jgi:hypothetical protein
MIPTKIQKWPQEWRELWVERAAIMEVEGHMPREKAEREAAADIMKLMAKVSR